MSLAVGAQAIDLNQLPFFGLDSSIIDRENIGDGVNWGSINYAWLVGISAMLGNAATVALGKNAVVFCEPEWGYESVGLGSSYPGGSIGTHVGGLTVAW